MSDLLVKFPAGFKSRRTGLILASAGIGQPSLFPYRDDSIWKLGIAQGASFEAATDVKTANLRDLPSGVVWVNSFTFSHDLIPAAETDPLKTVTDTNDNARSRTYRIPLTARPSDGSDAHMHILDPDGVTLHEAFGVTITDAGLSTASYTAGRVQTSPLRGTGIGPAAGTRANGGGALGGLIRKHETDPGIAGFKADPRYAGQNVPLVTHALALALRGSQLKFNRTDGASLFYTGGVTNTTDQPGWPAGADRTGFMSLLGYVWPATEQDANSGNPASLDAQYTGQNPMGTYAAIPGSTPVPTTLANAASAGTLTSAQKAELCVFHALQDYGSYVTDRSDATCFYVEYTGPEAGNTTTTEQFAKDLRGGASFDAGPVRRLLDLCRVVTINDAANPNGGPLGAARRGSPIVSIGGPGS